MSLQQLPPTFIKTSYRCAQFMQYKWLMIISPTCPACKRSIAVLSQRGENVNFIKFMMLPQPLFAEIREKFTDGRTTVPLIFYYGNFVGGSDELFNGLRQGWYA
jgi:glutaredoxin